MKMMHGEAGMRRNAEAAQTVQDGDGVRHEAQHEAPD